MLDQIWFHSNFSSNIVQHSAKNMKSIIVSSEICMEIFEMVNSVDERADESLSQEPIVLETPRKRDCDEIGGDATRSTVQQCRAMLLPFKATDTWAILSGWRQYNLKTIISLPSLVVATRATVHAMYAWYSGLEIVKAKLFWAMYLPVRRLGQQL